MTGPGCGFMRWEVAVALAPTSIVDEFGEC